MGAFGLCSALVYLDLSSCTSLTIIGDAAFSNSGLTSIILPESLITLGGNVFNTTPLTNIDFSRCVNLNEMGSRVFQNCKQLTISHFLTCAYKQMRFHRF